MFKKYFPLKNHKDREDAPCKLRSEASGETNSAHTLTWISANCEKINLLFKLKETKHRTFSFMSLK